MTAGPARAFGLQRPRIAAGRAADLALWDLRERYTVGEGDLLLAQQQLRVSRPRGAGALPADAGRRAHRTHGRRASGVMSEIGLYLADETFWPGVSVGAPGAAVGEAVFTTAMTGYQEALTDPSFARQILTFTAPMIGNYGVEEAASESRRVQPTALICHEARNYAPNGRTGLLDWLRGEGSRRALRARHARARAPPARSRRDARRGLRRGREPYRSARAAGERAAHGRPPARGRGLGASSTACRRRTLAAMSSCWTTAPRPRSCACWRTPEREVTVLPHDATAAQVEALAPDGVLLANGPGDPGSMDSHVAEVRAMIDQGRPLYGICLGHQLLGRALGLETFKLPFGHRGANHPVYEAASGRVLVTSQNHGFAVQAPENGDGALEVTHRSLYDGTVEGLRLRGRPVWSMQFHPEASPGPHDARDKLTEFVEACAGQAEGSG